MKSKKKNSLEYFRGSTWVGVRPMIHETDKKNVKKSRREAKKELKKYY